MTLVNTFTNKVQLEDDLVVDGNVTLGTDESQDITINSPLTSISSASFTSLEVPVITGLSTLNGNTICDNTDPGLTVAWPMIPVVKSNGTMEVGYAMDFHTSTPDLDDSDCRLAFSSGMLNVNQVLRVLSSRIEVYGEAAGLRMTPSDGTAAKTWNMRPSSDTLSLEFIYNSVVRGALSGVGAFSIASLGVTNGATIGTTLGVTGATTLNSLGVTNGATIGTTLGVTGATTLNSLGVTNGATIGTTLGVTGATTLNSLGVTNGATIGTTLAVPALTGVNTINGAGFNTVLNSIIRTHATNGSFEMGNYIDMRNIFGTGLDYNVRISCDASGNLLHSAKIEDGSSGTTATNYTFKSNVVEAARALQADYHVDYSGAVVDFFRLIDTNNRRRTRLISDVAGNISQKHYTEVYNSGTSTWDQTASADDYSFNTKSLVLNGSITGATSIGATSLALSGAITGATSIGVATVNATTVNATSLALSGAITGATSIGATSLALSGAITGATSINTINIPNLTGAYQTSAWPIFSVVKSDGAMEIGRYLDFHATSGDTNVDNKARIQCDASTNYYLKMDGGANAKFDSGTFEASTNVVTPKINGFNIISNNAPTTGLTWPAIPVIATTGMTEVGNAIYLHLTSANASSYSGRLDCITGGHLTYRNNDNLLTSTAYIESAMLKARKSVTMYDAGAGATSYIESTLSTGSDGITTLLGESVVKADGTRTTLASYGFATKNLTVSGTINGLNIGSTSSDGLGRTWPFIPHVSATGTAEVGTIIDFHHSTTSGVDRSCRMQAYNQSGESALKIECTCFQLVNVPGSSFLWELQPGIGSEAGRLNFINRTSARVCGYLTFDGTSLQLNNTITHNAPITDNDVIVVGKPVFINRDSSFEGVYVLNELGEYSKVSSTTEHRTSCISMVSSSGSHREFLGICVRKHEKGDEVVIETGSLRTPIKVTSHDTCDFATHGDYMFDPPNGTCGYNVGDLVLFDGTVVDDETPITARILKSTVGKVTAILNGTTLAVFKD
jgi:hypothetical protein